MRNIIKKLLRENLDKTITCKNKKCGWSWKHSQGGPDMYFCHKCGTDNTPDNINEAATKRDVIDFILDFNYLLSLNLAKVQSQAKDPKAKQSLAQMQQKFKTPVINGKTFFELADERITPRKDLFNPKFLSAYLTQIRNYLVYIKEHINRFVVDGIYKTGWLDRIARLETTYRNIIGTGSVSEVSNVLNEITSDKAWETFYSDTKKFPLFNGNKEIFDKLDTLYPKRNGQFNKGYFEFLYNLLKSNQLKDEDYYKAKQYLELFNKNINKIPADKRNLQQYKTLPDLYDVISDFEGTEDELSKRQQLKNVREKEIDRVYEDDEWRVLVPKTEQASCLVGKGTQWCTAADKSDNRFNLYNNQGKLYVVINKEDDSKYQLHFEDGQLMDARNRELPATYFFEHVLENAALEDWFRKERDDFYDFILKTSVSDISSGGYSELFQEALNSASDHERQEALNTLRNGSDGDAIAEGFLWEKDPYNIQDYQIENYIENFSDDEMFPRVIEHLKEIGVDFDDVADGSVRTLLQGFEDLKKHKLETDREYKIDKKRTLKILSVNTEKDFPRYKIRINDTNGLVPLDGLLSYLNNKSLFETKKFIKKNLRKVLKLNTNPEVIYEAAKGIGDLPEDIALFKLDLQSNELDFILYSKSEDKIYGVLSTVEVGNSIYDVGRVGADRGYGPFMYEMVMSYISPKYLMPSRSGDIKSRALDVWAKFYERNDVQKKILKIEDNLFTFAIITGEDDEFDSVDEKKELYDSLDKEGQDAVKVFNTMYQYYNPLVVKLVKKGDELIKSGQVDFDHLNNEASYYFLNLDY